MSRADSENNSAIPLKRYLIYLFVIFQFIFAWILIGLTVKMYERGFLNQSLNWLDTVDLAWVGMMDPRVVLAGIFYVVVLWLFIRFLYLANYFE